MIVVTMVEVRSINRNISLGRERLEPWPLLLHLCLHGDLATNIVAPARGLHHPTYTRSYIHTCSNPIAEKHHSKNAGPAESRSRLAGCGRPHIHTYTSTHKRTCANAHLRTYAHTHLRTYAPASNPRQKVQVAVVSNWPEIGQYRSF